MYETYLQMIVALLVEISTLIANITVIEVETAPVVVHITEVNSYNHESPNTQHFFFGTTFPPGYLQRRYATSAGTAAYEKPEVWTEAVLSSLPDSAPPPVRASHLVANKDKSSSLMYGRESEIKGFEDTHVMVFMGFGFLMTFLKKYCYSAVGLSLLIGAVGAKWAMVCQALLRIDQGKMVITKKTLAEADMMAATALISFGALLGVTSMPQLILITIIEVTCACANKYLIQEVFKAADVGGSMSIHLFGALFGLGASLALNTIKAPRGEANSPNTMPGYMSDVIAMIGTLFLWVYWPSFNAVLCQSSWEYERAVVNTYLALTSATVVTFIVSGMVSAGKKLNMLHVQHCTLAGGVAIGSIANIKYIPAIPMVVGALAAAVSVLGYKYITPALVRRGVLDTCGVMHVHGLPAVLAGLLSVLFAALAKDDDYGNVLVKHVFPRGAGEEQALNQLYALLATICISFIAGLVTGFLVRLLAPLKNEEKYTDTKNWLMSPEAN